MTLVSNEKQKGHQSENGNSTGPRACDIGLPNVFMVFIGTLAKTYSLNLYNYSTTCCHRIMWNLACRWEKNKEREGSSPFIPDSPPPSNKVRLRMACM